jgi:RNA polymerase sigma-70 factor, ECF subfamily
VDDIELINRARRGDEPAFSQLFASHQRAVYRYAAHMCGREQADDVVQETFLAVLRQADRRDAPRGAVGAYLLGIARHLVLKRLGAKYEALPIRSLDGNAEGDAPIDEEPTALDALTRAETIDAIRSAIAALPAAYREAVVLCELEELDYASAATVMQCPIGTVRSRLHRARALLVSSLAALTPVAQGSAWRGAVPGPRGIRQRNRS